MMLDTHIPLTDALHIMQTHHDDPWVQAFADHAMAALQTGATFSDTCASLGDLFTPMDTHVITISEASNQLPSGMMSLARYLKQKQRMQSAWHNALRYPKIMAIACLLLFWVMLQWVMPHFVELIDSLPQQPRHGITAALCWLTHTTHTHPISTVLCMGMTVMMAWVATRWLQQHPHRWPFFQSIHQVMRECHILNAIQLIAQARLPWHEAMGLMGQQNGPQATTWQRMRLALQNGHSLGDALGMHPDIQTSLRASLEIASKSNQMNPMLNTLLRQRQQTCEQRIAALQQQLEPLFTCLIGGIMALVIAALYTPLLNMGKLLW